MPLNDIDFTDQEFIDAINKDAELNRENLKESIKQLTVGDIYDFDLNAIRE